MWGEFVRFSLVFGASMLCACGACMQQMRASKEAEHSSYRENKIPGAEPMGTDSLFMPRLTASDIKHGQQEVKLVRRSVCHDAARRPRGEEASLWSVLSCSIGKKHCL